MSFFKLRSAERVLGKRVRKCSEHCHPPLLRNYLVILHDTQHNYNNYTVITCNFSNISVFVHTKETTHNLTITRNYCPCYICCPFFTHIVKLEFSYSLLRRQLKYSSLIGYRRLVSWDFSSYNTPVLGYNMSAPASSLIGPFQLVAFHIKVVRALLPVSFYPSIQKRHSHVHLCRLRRGFHHKKIIQETQTYTPALYLSPLYHDLQLCCWIEEPCALPLCYSSYSNRREWSYSVGQDPDPYQG